MNEKKLIEYGNLFGANNLFHHLCSVISQSTSSCVLFIPMDKPKIKTDVNLKKALLMSKEFVMDPFSN